jgi:hypothetical protein
MIIRWCAGEASRSEVPFSPVLGGSRFGSVISGGFDTDILSQRMVEDFIFDHRG